MDRNVAKKLGEIILAHSVSSQSILEVLEPLEPLSGFHQWADGHAFEGGYLVENDIFGNFWVLILEWNVKNGFYIVLFPEDKSGPVAEIHKSSIQKNSQIVHWRYSPRKRDGQNDLRKEYFSRYFLDLDVNISLPLDIGDVSDFLDECRDLYINTLKAHALDPDTPSYRNSFPEGKLKQKLHLSRERNSQLIVEVKKEAFKRTGKLECQCCGFDFAETYGEIGKEFIEAHHLVPVSDLSPDGGETKKEDIALVCANCHRMLHRKRPWLTLGELKNITSA